MDIDFVIPWVDGGDPIWVAQRNEYCDAGKKIHEAQYRDWSILKYWFRAVELYAPWVRKIHFVTCGQVPEWMNVKNEKLNLVHHRDYIPEEYWPTFGSHVIELNFHRINDLAEHFVYFNDDMFLMDYVVPEDFFVDGKPRECPIMAALTPSVVQDPFIHYLCNDIAVINAHFNKYSVLKAHWNKWFSLKYKGLIGKNIYYGVVGKFTGFQNFHLPSSMMKSVFEEVWALEPELLHNTCKNRFRGLNDVNQYVMSYYNICKGDFVPRTADFGKFYTIGENNEEMYSSILNRTYKTLCLNDNPLTIEFEAEKRQLMEKFEKAFPNKSSFEI